MSRFWERIRIDEPRGTILDADRRYLMMRTDVLMGMLHELPPSTRTAVLSAFAASTRKHGGRSVNAYRQVDGLQHLADTVIQGAASFGWGTWRIALDQGGIVLDVENSPFAAGYGPSDMPVCAPISGIFHSLAEALLDAPVEVTETSCAAHHGGQCSFVARRAELSR